MNLLQVKASAIILAAGFTFAFSGVDVNAQGLSELLPTAGFGVTASEGMTVTQVKEDVKTLASTTKSVTLEKEVIDVEMPEREVKTMEEELEEEYSNLVIARVNSYVNVRDLPDENDGKIVGKLYDKSVGNFIEEVNGWYKIESGNCTGYVKAEYCVTGEDAIEVAKEVGTRIATVTCTTLRVREEPSTDAAILGLVPIADELVVTEELDGWVKVDIEEGLGYVSTEYVTLSTEFVKAESKEEEEARLKKEEQERAKARAAAEKAAQRAAAAAAAAANADGSGEAAPAVTYSASGSGMGSSVANYALQFVGNPYAFGGTSLTNGADCSGFVMSVYANFGVGLPHSSAGDRGVGYDVGGLANAQPGDIVCYSGHVGIYIGNGQIVHASTPRTGIVVGSATYRTPLCVRRIF